MERRKFITSGIGAGIATGAAITFGGVDNLLAGNAAQPYDLIAVRGGEPDVMFDKGIEALGGMSQFVKPGQKVVIKPNIGWDRVPERGANTNPILVKRIVEQCLKAGAKEVFVSYCSWSAMLFDDQTLVIDILGLTVRVFVRAGLGLMSWFASLAKALKVQVPYMVFMPMAFA